MAGYPVNRNQNRITGTSLLNRLFTLPQQPDQCYMECKNYTSKSLFYISTDNCCLSHLCRFTLFREQFYAGWKLSAADDPHTSLASKYGNVGGVWLINWQNEAQVVQKKSTCRHRHCLLELMLHGDWNGSNTEAVDHMSRRLSRPSVLTK